MTDSGTPGGGITRRKLAIGVGGTVALLGIGGVAKFAGSEPLCRPPGGQDEEHLIAECLRCEKCYEACPTGVIVTAKIEAGLINVRTPTLNFKLNWCDYCDQGNDGHPLCVEVCPTAALRLPEGATRENVILGTAYLVEDWCLGWQLRGCRRCYEECPFDAIEMDAHERPRVIPEKCNGCGLCENICPSLMAGSYTVGATDRAITIKPVETLRLLALEQAGEEEQ
ncbi:MAG: 4Fe-4S dicluster domain-containing protein [Coriobacteriales bacterium]|jgi:ferredoxin-type protein NapG|nr:4Fe-4S dicluster domain-containing protein [Coriobacteriales bacterium]